MGAMKTRSFRSRQIWLPSFFGRLTFLLTVLSLITLYVYLVGNLQGFTDRTLIILFEIESWILVLTGISGVFSTLSYVITVPFRNRLRLDRIVFSGMAAVLGLLLYLGVALVRAFMSGYAGA